MTLSIIVAVAQNGIIGNNGQMPWHIGEDLKRFKRITMGHPVVMGRKTFESLGGKPLPGRTNVVVSRNPAFAVPEGVVLAGSLDEAIARFDHGDDEVFIIGGGEIYRQAMPRADKLYLTRIEASPEGDTHFPKIGEKEWRMVGCEKHPAETNDPTPAFEFIDYNRIY